MDVENLIILIVGLFNIILGVLVLKKNYKNTSNLFFGLTCIFAGFWTISMAFLHSIKDIEILEIILRTTWIFSVFPPLFYLLFTLNFPYPTRYNKIQLFFTLIPLIIITFVAFNYFRVEEIFFKNNILIEKVNFVNYLVYAIYFFLYIILGFIVLSKKYLSSTGINRLQIRYILISTVITFLVVTFFSVVLPLVNKYFYDWFSPIFTLINFFIISYLIFFRSRIDN